MGGACGRRTSAGSVGATGKGIKKEWKEREGAEVISLRKGGVMIRDKTALQRATGTAVEF